jgi:hypothetical protein
MSWHYIETGTFAETTQRIIEASAAVPQAVKDIVKSFRLSDGEKEPEGYQFKIETYGHHLEDGRLSSGFLLKTDWIPVPKPIDPSLVQSAKPTDL